MEFRKKNWKDILNNWIASISLILVTFLMGLGFLPILSVNADNIVTQSDINDAGIYFVAAKTKSRSADGIKKSLQIGKKPSTSADAPEFYTYQYNYNNYTDTKLYYGTNGEIFSNASNSSVIGSNTLYTPLSEEIFNRNYGFIPYGVNYFDNVSGQKEEIFYDNADNGDFVLLNNYTSATDEEFNVENFYLSFGSPYIDELTTTPLYDLTVVGKLYSEGTEHLLALNPVENTTIHVGSSSESNKYAYYWNQYLDLKNLTAYSYNEESSETYDIENEQGRYEFTFTFGMYNDDLTPSSEPQKTFVFSFYLLDANEYTSYPTLNNADILAENLEVNKVNEYYYNFTKDSPYIEYDPTKYNLSYTSSNNLTSVNNEENITSSFASKTYINNFRENKNYPLGVITYRNGSTIVKEVYILTNYNDDKSLVEYLYLSISNPSSTPSIPETYQAFVDALTADLLDFEYKITVVREKGESSYKTSTFETTTYANYPLIAGEIVSVNGNVITSKDDVSSTGIDNSVDTLTSEYTLSFNNNNYTFTSDGKTTNIATLGDVPATADLISNISMGVVLNKNTLEISSDTTLTNLLTKYTLTTTIIDNVKHYTLNKDYIDGQNNNQSTEITLLTTNGENRRKDPIHNNITIIYNVTDGEITSIKFTILDEYQISNIGTNVNEKLINFLVNPSEIDLEYSYRLEVDKLGIYNFSYSYICPADDNKYYINSTSANIDNSSNSTNFLTPTDFTTSIVDTQTSTSSSATETLYYVEGGYLGESEALKITLNGNVYTYLPSTEQVSMNGTMTYDLNTSYEVSPFIDKQDSKINVIFKVDNISNKYYFRAMYEIGEISSYTDSTTQITAVNGKNGYRNYITNLTTTIYTLDVKSDDISDNPEWERFKNSIIAIENYEKVDTDYVSYTKTQSTTETVQGQDKLHIFGSITYFNKSNSYTDSGYAELKQVDNKLGYNYVSDVTSKFVDKYSFTSLAVSDINLENIFKGKIASLLNKDNIVITDVTPILWKNFSTLSYNNKKSRSYIYRYTDYSFNNDGSINYGDDVQISTYSKDIYCQFDGLYEIVVFYNYDNRPVNDANYVYYQVFTFIIDNSSPNLNIEVENDNGEYEALGLNTYTNRNVRLIWEVPTYFQNDIYLEINKTEFIKNSVNYFNAVYYDRNENNQLTPIQVISGNSVYARSISSANTLVKDNKNYYYVDLKANSTYDLSGNYKVTMHYNANGKSTFTEEFVIDMQNISGLNILPVVKNNDGSYEVDHTISFNDLQIVNSDFTFRFDKKQSGADIYVYYDKIELVASSDFDSIVNGSDGIGITSKYSLNGDKISIGTQYLYNYSHLTDEDIVETNNLLTSNNSCIFLFRMVDEAGNECRYVVFYDKTEPRFITSPEPDSISHIVNDTTRVIWGDYKAIKVLTSTTLEIDNLDELVDNYSVESDEKLNLILRYMNTSSNFNNLKVEKIVNSDSTYDYYILIPVNSVQIEDEKYFNNISLNNAKEYCFFPNNPIFEENSTNYIYLPKYDENGQIVISNGVKQEEKYKVLSSSFTKVYNDYGQQVDRYAAITYEYVDGQSVTSKTIYGAIGEGEFIYSINDGLGNSSSGLLWMNTDMTETYAYGIFDYSNNLDNAIALTSDSSTYSASKLFISSKIGDTIPAYTVTGMHYAYDTSLYTDYTIDSITLVNDASSLASSLQLEMHLTADASITKTINVPVTNELGQDYPIYSYPYSLEGRPIVASTGNTSADIYSNGYTSTSNRKYSLALNTTTDTNKRKVVTEEGLYIFTRKYTQELTDTELGNDTMIRYYVYYIDRSGIINISSSTSVTSTNYNIGSAIGFTLGSGTSVNTYERKITANTIQNNQIDLSSTYSNSNYISSDLFDTNKIQVEFTLTYDKHNFDSFVSNYQSAYANKIQLPSGTSDTITKDKITTLLNTYIFNSTTFNNRYALDLSLTVGGNNTKGTTIINEKEGYYSSTAASTYLKNANSAMVGGKRSNYYYFYYDAGSNYYIININDQAGYRKMSDDGKTLEDRNYLANNLNITFDITHDAPEGEFYGKYYGRHDYDNNSEVPTNESIPTDSNGYYAILSKYLQEGQLEPLSDKEQSIVQTQNGDYVKLYSTNNETMIFTFSITNDEYRAQIDPNNLKIYKGAISSSNLIFNMVGGNLQDTNLVSADRQSHSYILNEINGTKYYAIIIFDNNLDEILDEDEKNSEYSQYRLLDAKDNPDEETYYIQLNYVGNSSDYTGTNGSYYSTTYEIAVDRIKPTYNLSKLMSMDKYTYNTIDSTVTTTNYEDVFNSYNSVYNFTYDEEHDYYRSDLENYFFAIDHRENTSFKFESISSLDNDRGIYVRLVNKNNYKFSVTPDDYKAYYNAVYLQGHPQFTPSNSTAILNNKTTVNLEENKYYHISFNLDGDGDDNSISAYYLKNLGIFKENCYYEIIEEDATGNYRVYAVYIPEYTSNSVTYTYQTNSNISSLVTVPIIYGNNPKVSSSGMELEFTSLKFKDNYLRANIEITTNKITHVIDVILNPSIPNVVVTNRTTKSIMWTYDMGSVDKNGYTNTDSFMEAINYTLDYYYSLINDKTHAYYSQYGYEVNIDIVDRIGVSIVDSSTLFNYEIKYTVAGSTLSPIFVDNTNNFTMKLEGQKGSTYLTSITVLKFNKSWTQLSVDNSSSPKIFNLSQEELKGSIDYLFNRGVYKFIFTDNFGRENTFFHEFGISSSQTGGSLYFSGAKSTLADGYTYSADQIQYSYDSSVYNVYIKFIGKIPDEFADGEFVQIDDAQNDVFYNSSKTYSADYLRNYYGISVITSGNITTITFYGIKDNSSPSGTTDLSKYHIKTILASNAENYTWGDESSNKNIYVYDKKIALYTAVQNVSIRNLSGNSLDTTNHLNLTEDFELVTKWNSTVAYSERLEFNSRIILTRTYNDNGTIKTTTTSVSSGKIISQAGDYTAYVINDLGMISNTISFTRGEGQISMYAVYAVNNANSTEQKLSPSSLITTEETESKVLFTYFITNDYFSFVDSQDGTIITTGETGNLKDYISDPELTNKISTNLSANKYLDIRVNSNLNIKTEIHSIGEEDGCIYIQYRIYSDTSTGDIYTYRFIKVIFVDSTNTTLANVEVYNAGAGDNNLALTNSVIASTASNMTIKFNFGDEYSPTLSPLGDTIYVDRYYNGVLAETTVLNMTDLSNIPSYSLTAFSTVGLHEFVIRDLAGRTHKFIGNSDKLQIYLINQVLYTVNGETPINNQIFNGKVDIDVVYSLTGLTLYNSRSIEISVTRNGKEISTDDNMAFTTAGYYTIKLEAETSLGNNSSTRIYSTYSFVIIDESIAQKSFSISKGTGFTIDKIVKIVAGQNHDLTDTYSTQLEKNTSPNVGTNGNWFIGNTDTGISANGTTPYVGLNGNWFIGESDTGIKKQDAQLVWLTYDEQGNSTFDITLKKYDEVSNIYRTFNFRIWINAETPTIISSVTAGTSTKDSISINYNAGLIYSQIGNGYIKLNDETIVEINENSESTVSTVTIEKKGTYWFRIYSADGELVSSYKFIKKDPLNNMTKTILVCVAIGVVVIVGIFFFLRRKGKYR